jgi:hypothetical protein
MAERRPHVITTAELAPRARDERGVFTAMYAAVQSAQALGDLRIGGKHPTGTTGMHALAASAGA